MSDLFDFEARTDRYAVMGNPVSHSQSPRIHSLFADQTGQKIDYTAIQVDPGGFEQAVGNFSISGGRGLNITVPFKEEAWRLVTQRSKRAERAGAVNTIKFENNQILGDNTDGIGLVNDLVKNHHIEINGKQVLLMGAGGAARGVIEPLLNEQPAKLVVVNRTIDKARSLADEFSDLGTIQGSGYEELGDQVFDIIINATAASLKGDVPPLLDHALAKGGVCYDMMYGPEPTAFVLWARQHEASKALDGLGMLVEQAAESFFIWRGVRPMTQAVITQLREEITPR